MRNVPRLNVRVQRVINIEPYNWALITFSHRMRAQRLKPHILMPWLDKVHGAKTDINI